MRYLETSKRFLEKGQRDFSRKVNSKKGESSSVDPLGNSFESKNLIAKSSVVRLLCGECGELL